MRDTLGVWGQPCPEGEVCMHQKTEIKGMVSRVSHRGTRVLNLLVLIILGKVLTRVPPI